MTQHPLTNRAESAYLAYGNATGHRTHDGRLMPTWADLGDTIQAAWVAAAGALVPEFPLAFRVFEAWREDCAEVCGSEGLFLDLDAAKEFAAKSYADGEHGDPHTEQPGELTWTEVSGRWYLADGATDTGFVIVTRSVYRRR